MSEIDINQVLSQMRAMSQQAQGTQNGMNAGVTPVQESGNAVEDFSTLLAQSVDKVNTTQQTGSALAQAFDAGDRSVDLGEVMVAVQKASVSFQAMTQVRNKLVEAYKDVMNMPI